MDDSPRAAASYAPACRTWTSTRRATRSSMATTSTNRTRRTLRWKRPPPQDPCGRDFESRSVLRGGGRWFRATGRDEAPRVERWC